MMMTRYPSSLIRQTMRSSPRSRQRRLESRQRQGEEEKRYILGHFLRDCSIYHSVPVHGISPGSITRESRSSGMMTKPVTCVLVRIQARRSATGRHGRGESGDRRADVGDKRALFRARVAFGLRQPRQTIITSSMSIAASFAAYDTRQRLHGHIGLVSRLRSSHPPALPSARSAFTQPWASRSPRSGRLCSGRRSSRVRRDQQRTLTSTFFIELNGLLIHSHLSLSGIVCVLGLDNAGACDALALAMAAWPQRSSRS